MSPPGTRTGVILRLRLKRVIPQARLLCRFKEISLSSCHVSK